ncbi:TetR/AcrR family transcriptional regulator [Variovorax sp.]|uniref:TetR/AcrR family transcriptional regulator n=1 Tax=Variovorax sp. TaxID=1871043 RepID=UPI002D502F1F|nr:CerR family C-terminal domain-containing protein [Variovorax sp.]HYP84001.1 CerR family C-terminal domain-containing protein [Variovorax sp.]
MRRPAATSPKRASPSRPLTEPPLAAPRRGEATRRHLLETAGRVFGELGFAGGTTKEIARRAGTPMASVNYHFGSREALYEAVLIEAHGQLLALDELRDIASSGQAPMERLRRLLVHLASMAASPSPPWGFRVLARETMSPSAVLPALIDKAARPKVALVRPMMAQVLGMDAEDPAVQRAMVLSVLPAIVLMIAPRQALRDLLPGVLQDPQGLQDDLVRYVQGGLAAVARARRPAPAAKGRPAGKARSPGKRG